MRLKLSQPSLAGVGAGAELGNMAPISVGAKLLLHDIIFRI